MNRDRDDPSYLCVRFEIRYADGKAILREQTSASDRMRWSMEWDGDRRVFLKSSDIGTYRWTEGDDGTWNEQVRNAEGEWVDAE